MDIFSAIIWLVILGAFVYPFAKTVIQKQAAPPPGRRPVGGPRGLFESGGYEAPQETRPDPRTARPEMRRTPPAVEDASADAPSIRRVPAQESEAVRGSRTVDARQVRGQLRNPRSVRSAVILREILDRPAALRDDAIR